MKNPPVFQHPPQIQMILSGAPPAIETALRDYLKALTDALMAAHLKALEADKHMKRAIDFMDEVFDKIQEIAMPDEEQAEVEAVVGDLMAKLTAKGPKP